MHVRQLFATNLRRIRHARKLSQEQLAHDAEIDRAVTYVGLEIIEKLASILDGRSGRVLPATFPVRLP
jgi:transcriptional regulator with XRE-family HTH domain